METKRKKGIAPPRYDEAFKARAVGLVTEEGRPSAEVAKELGVCIDTLRSWLKAATGEKAGAVDHRQNREARHVREHETEIRALRKVGSGKGGGHKNPKKIRGHVFKAIEEKYRYIRAERSGASVEKLCQAFSVSRSGYYAWLTRKPGSGTDPGTGAVA